MKFMILYFDEMLVGRRHVQVHDLPSKYKSTIYFLILRKEI